MIANKPLTCGNSATHAQPNAVPTMYEVAGNGVRPRSDRNIWRGLTPYLTPYRQIARILAPLILAALLLTAAPAVADDADPAQSPRSTARVTGKVQCSTDPAGSLVTWAIATIDPAAVLTVTDSPDGSVNGQLVPVVYHERVRPFTGVRSVGFGLSDGTRAQGSVDLSKCLSAGARPVDRMYRQHKRSCKHEAKKWTRLVWVIHEEQSNGQGYRYWVADVTPDKWTRVSTPLGCKLRHERWERRNS